MAKLLGYSVLENETVGVDIIQHIYRNLSDLTLPLTVTIVAGQRLSRWEAVGARLP